MLHVAVEFASRGTHDLFNGIASRAARSILPAALKQRALDKLAVNDAATTLEQLRVPPGERLEILRGDRAGQCSIRINRYRICFRRTVAGPIDVEIVDYHSWGEHTNRPLTIPTHRRPTPPGEILLREFLEPLGLTQSAFAAHIGITKARLSEIIHGKRPVTMDSALRFERALGFSAEFWMRMQMTLDLYDALRGSMAKAVGRIKPIGRAS